MSELQNAERQAPEPTRDRPHVRPAADVLEKEDSVVLLLDVPGLDENDLEVTLEKNTLVLRGATPEAKEGSRPLWAEFGPCVYERSFRVSDAIDREKIEAVLRDGVLRIVLPKSQQSLSRRIAVQRS